MKALKMYYDIQSLVNELTDREAGILFKALYHYMETGIKPDFPGEREFLNTVFESIALSSEEGINV